MRKKFAVFISQALLDPIGCFERLAEKGVPYAEREDAGINLIVNAIKNQKDCWMRFVSIRDDSCSVLFEACSEMLQCDHRVEVIVECPNIDELYERLPDFSDDDFNYVSCAASEECREHDWPALFVNKYSKPRVVRNIINTSIADEHKLGYVSNTTPADRYNMQQPSTLNIDYVEDECAFDDPRKLNNKLRAEIRELCSDCSVWLAISGNRVTFHIPLDNVQRFRTEMIKISQQLQNL